MDDLISRQAAIDAIWDGINMDIYTKEVKEILEELPSAQSEIIRCKDCKHKPHTSDKYDYDNGDCGFEIIFPDHRYPCQCEDRYYNRIPDDDWYCGNAERRTKQPEREHTMEEFMYGQDMGNPEDGSL